MNEQPADYEGRRMEIINDEKGAFRPLLFVSAWIATQGAAGTTMGASKREHCDPFGALNSDQSVEIA